MNRRRTMVTPATAERKAPTAVGSGELLGRLAILPSFCIISRILPPDELQHKL
jgi:hypothetical protein